MERADFQRGADWTRDVETQTPVQYEQLVEKLFSKELEKYVDLQDFRIFHDKRYSGKSGHQH